MMTLSLHMFYAIYEHVCIPYVLMYVVWLLDNDGLCSIYEPNKRMIQSLIITIIIEKDEGHIK